MQQIFQETGVGARGDTTGTPQEAQAVRQRRMAALAFADETTLEAEAAKLANSFSYTFLRRPEAGMVMLEGRAGNTGQRFNVGEMLMTRCVLRLEPQGSGSVTEGYAFVQGNRPRHAELAALFDALLQQEGWAESLDRSLIGPLVARREEQLRKRAEETAPTKVDFFTLVRGEDE
ncbi:MAG: phosphonate C-P lyase system protein PhnG [Betaproteobacteria bacterium]|nr:phosphonate C-P lyase system protein PhnG [Betaproteobacteria bacterium]